MKVVTLCVVLACFASGCVEDTDPACPSADPDRWTRLEPSSYVFESCGTGFGPKACTIIAVEDGRVVATYDVDETDGFAPQAPADAETLSGGFGAVDCSECRVSVNQDFAWGYVSRVYRDCGEEGYGMEIECFAANTTDPEACR